MPNQAQHDVLILGAGVSGLVAARELAEQGLKVAILEARDRVGGRIHTLRDPAFPMPVELGAEFVHGEQPEIFALLDQFGVARYDLPNTHWQRALDGKWFLTDLAEDLDPIMAPAKRAKERETFDEHLRRFEGQPQLADTLAMARAYVEGYDAADPARIGAKAVGEEWAAGNVGDEPQFRLMQGYGALVDGLHAAVRELGVEVHLRSVVRAVRWSKGRVEVTADVNGRESRFDAKRAVVTFPLGVLQRSADAGGVAFDPDIAEHRAAARRLGFGPVTKVVLRFREAWWEDEALGDRIAGRSLRDAAFFHAPGAAIPTWWTMLPLRVPVLGGWAGGPQTTGLTGKPAEEILAIAKATLAELFALPKGRIAELYVAGHACDWPADPFARGAYSYELAGEQDARTDLAKSLQKTLFFAGEATDTEGGASTVAGAIASAQRVVREVLGRSKP